MIKLVPLPAFRYVIVLINSSKLWTRSGGIDAGIGAAMFLAGGGFSECNGLEITLETLDYQEGGRNGFVHRLPTRSKPSDIVLKRGLLVASDLWAWARNVADGIYQRKDGAIIQLGYHGIPEQVWLFRRGLPLKWSGPALSASQNGVAMESLTIAHEGLDYIGLSSLI